MTKVVLEMTISLDGVAAGPDVSLDYALGKGGERLHHWVFDGKSEVDVKMIEELMKTTGAVILGKRTYDVGLQHWKDTPFPAPSFVVTHQKHEKKIMKSGAFTFVNDGIESALRQAKAAAGDRNVVVMGGTDIAQQYVKAGLLDYLHIHMVPVLMGEGVRLFEHTGVEQIELETKSMVASPNATHYKFKVVK
jgi:dihydrofolate reductase